MIIAVLIYAVNWMSVADGILLLLSIINTIVALMGLIRFRKSPFIAPIFLVLAYVTYSITIGRYLFPEIAPNINGVIGLEFDFLGLFIVLLFLSIFSVSLNKSLNTTINISPTSHSSVNTIISVVSIIIALIMQFSFMRAVESGRGEYTPIYEYSIVFCIISLFYSLNSPILKRIILVILGAMILRDFSLGHRATAIQITMLIYALVLTKYYSFKKLISLFCISILIFNLVAAYRASFSFSVDMIFDNLYFSVTEQYFAADTAYFAWVASLTFLSVQNVTPIAEIINNLINFSLSMIVPGTVGSNLYTITKEFYQHANGGILPLYMFYYFSYLAIPITSLVVAAYFNLLSATNHVSFKHLVFIFVFVTTPRWLIYAPTALFRGVALFAIVVVAMFCFKNLLTVTARIKHV